MKKSVKKWVLFSLRWGIAVAGVWYVLAQISLHDRVMLLDENNKPVWRELSQPAGENYQRVKVGDEWVEWEHLWSKPDVKTVTLTDSGRQAPLVAMHLTQDMRHVIKWLIRDPQTQQLRVIEWSDKHNPVLGYGLRTPNPPVEVGVTTLLQRARPNWQLLALALAIFPITFLLTSYRWHELLLAVQIRMGIGRAFVLNMVGAFYNTFMLGSTGGDVLKALYASKLTPHRTRAVLSVFFDRVIGLLALVVLGGMMASWQYVRSADPSDPTARACRKIAVVSGAIILGTVAGWIVFFSKRLRKASGLQFIIERLPMQKQVEHAMQAMEMYNQRLGTVAVSLLITLPVHATVAASAMFAGKAFGLPLAPLYYFVAVPVIVLVGAIPISPQGAGVMEGFAVLITRSQGVTVSQALALAMSIRLVQIVWNLTGGIFVFWGGYHAPSQDERRHMADEEETPVSPGSPCASTQPDPAGARRD